MFELRRIWIKRDVKMRDAWRTLLVQAKLYPDEDVDYTVGIFLNDTLVATGSYQGTILKCLVVCSRYQSENLLTKIVVHLLNELQAKGINHTFVYTKPENGAIFHSLGFSEILMTDAVLFMEIGTPNFATYLQWLSEQRQSREASAIVMNANPFTKGHLFLVEQAAKLSEQVYVFVLSENQSTFSFADRLAMVRAGVAEFANVTVVPTENYLVSSLTFPTYFLKDQAPLELAKIQARVDATLFKEKIAPVLGITKRFVGEEPYSKVTEVYNQAMKEVFAGEIELYVFSRLTIKGEIVSATKVRQALKENNQVLLKQLLPQSSYEYLEKNYNYRGELVWK
ncbi:[citrate (pro-3S)-lyase] ligase [Enterococcus camelliae]|uniref:[Citrate [pro-3S]-lyase] ligase n=1 Tax=Enterococcus camelliae TaxID=453959 RepID=A0ABW5TGY1_9ENTE